MKKLSFHKIKKSFPITFLNAQVQNKAKLKSAKGISASNYQSDHVNKQEFYRPISKILRF